MIPFTMQAKRNHFFLVDIFLSFILQITKIMKNPRKNISECGTTKQKLEKKVETADVLRQRKYNE